MELFRTADYYIFRQGEHSLWCSRKTGILEPRTAWDLTKAEDPHCMGLVHGIVGKLNPFPDTDPQLLIIESCSLVGYVWRNQPIFKINKIGLLSLGQQEAEITTHPCSKHSNSVAFNQRPDDSGSKPSHSSRQQEAFAKTWGSIKSATKSLKSTTVQAAHKIGIDGREGDRGARRIWDEIEKMFTHADSFYFSSTVDLTNSVPVLGERYNSPTVCWRSANSRFFWNEFLLKELIELEDPKADPWIVPVLHGYIHVDTVPVVLDGATNFNKPLILLLISRRSRNRAGTRYKRRGVDENGYVANYVETEQCLIFGDHILSFVQVRGSVPVFWSQPGFKYRPPPQIDRDVEETRLAFKRHFERELPLYGNLCIVNLVEQSGKEKIIGDAFMEQIIHANDARITYVTFDFHEHCRGMRFENVGRLLNGLEDVLHCMKYTWIDSHGVICRQQSTFRINCMDCLDRTNVCQTAFGKFTLECQLSKLGILPPEGTFWPALKAAFNTMWANNGDVLSRQYAGTNALKGDFTRTGERRFAGMMKDGMNSANRYYLNRFKDTLKQTAIDLVLGNIQPEDALNILCGQNNVMEDDEEIVLQTADRVRQVIEDCRKQFISPDEIIVGSWGLVDAHPVTGDPTQVDMDAIVILSREHLYVVSYDDDADHVRACKIYALAELTKLEVGSEGKTNILSNASVNFLKSPKREAAAPPTFFMRIHIRNSSDEAEVLQFRSTRLRFFNNMAVPICKTEDMNESLKAIAETIHVTMDITGVTIPYIVGTLEKMSLKNNMKIGYMEVPRWHGFPRNASEGQLSALKQAGNKALSSVTSHFSRLKPPVIPRNLGRSASKKKEVSDQTIDPSVVGTLEAELRIRSSSSSLNDLTSFSLIKDVLHLPSVGVLFLTSNEIRLELTDPVPEDTKAHEKPSQPKVLLRCVSAGQFESRCLPKGRRNGESSQLNGLGENVRLTVTPEIQIIATDGKEGCENSSTVSVQRSRHLSHSSDPLELGVTGEESTLLRASSETSLGTNTVHAEMKSSQSNYEGLLPIGTTVLTSFKIPTSQFNIGILTSPTSVKGNPLVMLAKGVQNLGSNLDPRKMLDSRKDTLICKDNVEEDITKQKSCTNTRIINL